LKAWGKAKEIPLTGSANELTDREGGEAGIHHREVCAHLSNQQPKTQLFRALKMENQGNQKKRVKSGRSKMNEGCEKSPEKTACSGIPIQKGSKTH
jgi:hypothetical protein